MRELFSGQVGAARTVACRIARCWNKVWILTMTLTGSQPAPVDAERLWATLKARQLLTYAHDLAVPGAMLFGRISFGM